MSQDPLGSPTSPQKTRKQKQKNSPKKKKRTSFDVSYKMTSTPLPTSGSWLLFFFFFLFFSFFFLFSFFSLSFLPSLPPSFLIEIPRSHTNWWITQPWVIRGGIPPPPLPLPPFSHLLFLSPLHSPPPPHRSHQESLSLLLVSDSPLLNLEGEGGGGGRRGRYGRQKSHTQGSRSAGSVVVGGGTLGKEGGGGVRKDGEVKSADCVKTDGATLTVTSPQQCSFSTSLPNAPASTSLPSVSTLSGSSSHPVPSSPPSSTLSPSPPGLPPFRTPSPSRSPYFAQITPPLGMLDDEENITFPLLPGLSLSFPLSLFLLSFSCFSLLSFSLSLSFSPPSPFKPLSLFPPPFLSPLFPSSPFPHHFFPSFPPSLSPSFSIPQPNTQERLPYLLWLAFLVILRIRIKKAIGWLK